MDFLRELLRLLRALSDRKVEYVLVGGGALNVHGLVRATEDADLFVRPDGENIARLREALRDVWDDPSIDEITAEDLCGDYPAIRYGPPEGVFYLDILTRLGELFSYDDLEWELVDLEGVPVRVATAETLVRMKRSTVRPIDAADVQALVQAFGLDIEEDGKN